MKKAPVLEAIPMYLVLLIYLLFDSSNANSGERVAVPDDTLIQGSHYIFVGQVLGFEKTETKFKKKYAKLARVWVYEVLKGKIQPNSSEARREIKILVPDPNSEAAIEERGGPIIDGSIHLQKDSTYLFFTNRSSVPGRIFELYSREHEALPMQFTDTAKLIAMAKKFEDLKKRIAASQKD